MKEALIFVSLPLIPHPSAFILLSTLLVLLTVLRRILGA